MRDKLFIGGEWVLPLEGATFAVFNPATEAEIHRMPEGRTEDIDRAVASARRAFDVGPWRNMSGQKRAEYLRSMANGIRDRQDELARLEVIDNGKPLPEAILDVSDAAYCFDYYAELAATLDTHAEEPIKVNDARFRVTAVREAIGVAGAIIPWNFPLLMAAWKVAPALAAGCTVVLKPSELTPLTAMELAAIAEKAKLPEGVLNVVSGTGIEAGRALVEHPDVDKIAFTGSVPTGTTIMAAAARSIKNISLELGGKSPLIVFDDADIAKAIEWTMFGIFWNQGQVCSATSRVLVQRHLYPQYISRLCEEAQKIKIGPGLDEGTLLGPLVSRGQLEKVISAVEQAKQEGANVRCGGKKPTGLENGYFLEPTVLTDMSTKSSAWTQEIFGPVVCVLPFDTEEEATFIANDSRFGLAAAVISADLERCERVAGNLRAGIVWINCSQPTFTEAPWGGYKQSGIGRELGRWGLDNYLETKQVTRFDPDHNWGWYIKK